MTDVSKMIDARGRSIDNWSLLIDDRGTIYRWTGRTAGTAPYGYFDEVRRYGGGWWVQLGSEGRLLNPQHLLVWDESIDQLIVTHISLPRLTPDRRKWYERTMPRKRYPSRSPLQS